jgi:hypothetical protein
MLIGVEGRWWNRNLPIKPIGIILGLLLMAGSAYLYFEPVLRTCVWTVTHRSTVAYQGLSFRVPWMWRQEETPAGQREIRLVRARWGEPVSFESIVIRRAASPSGPPQTVTKRLETLAFKLGQTDFRGAPLPLDPETALRYSCITPHFDKLREWQVSCISTDDLWSVNLYGPISDIDGFAVVLRHLASAQKQPL